MKQVSIYDGVAKHNVSHDVMTLVPIILMRYHGWQRVTITREYGRRVFIISLFYMNAMSQLINNGQKLVGDVACLTAEGRLFQRTVPV